MPRCLVIIDIQNDYFAGGAYPLVEPEPAVRAAKAVLEEFRALGEPVVHVRHVWEDLDASFMRPGTLGVEIHPLVMPVDGEPVVEKEHPNAFRGTSLAELLGARGADDLVIMGMMTSMCVDATVRSAVDAGYPVTVIGDACAAPDLEFGGRRIAGLDVHAAFLAALADSYATVTTAQSFTLS